MANIEELLESEEFLDKLANTKSDEEVIKVFKDNGIELGEEQLKAIKANLNEVMKSIPQEELEGVSGGFDTNINIHVDERKMDKLLSGALIGTSVGHMIGIMRAGKKIRNYNPRDNGGKRRDAIIYGIKTSIKEGLKGSLVGAAVGTAGAAVADATNINVVKW